MEAWVRLASEDPDVEDVLLVLGRAEIRWTDLYHALEVVFHDVGRRVHDDGWATRAEVIRFKQTANSRAALGPDARHGHRRHEAPANPMDESDARELVFRVVRSWLNDKCAAGGA
jgi:hypothetical protein